MKSEQGARREEVFDHVDLKKLPSFAELNEQVQEVVRTSSWWDLYGQDWMIAVAGMFGAILSYFIMGKGGLFCLGTGMALLGFCHCILAIKCAHLAPHGAMFGPRNKKLARLGTIFFMELIGTFSQEMIYEIHIKVHHPHTNIIGLGDSSTWKAPFVPSYIYMFITPLLAPLIAPVLSIVELWGKWFSVLRCVVVMSLGLSINIALMMHVSGFTLFEAVLCTWAARGIFSIPYIHINIFQHIGLPMYSAKSRPKRIYQMATSCLNLSRNLILDWCFGHSVVSCHVEHHLFPTLGDNMCLKIQPLVSKFLKKNNLPYHEASYTNRVWYFIKEYKSLMVHLPPITHFVGIQ